MRNDGGDCLDVHDGIDASEVIGSVYRRALASCGSEDIKLWTPKAIDKAVSPTRIELDQQVQKLVRGRFEYFKRFIDNIEYISCGLELTSSDEE
ncbi:hypothetical protein V6N13_124560 [Hibiscus sabdariffa]